MTTTAAGVTLHVSAGTPATYNEAGFEALTWTNVGQCQQLGEFGKTYQDVTSTVLSRRGEIGYKGTFKAGQLSFPVELDRTDAGQTLMLTALDSDDNYSFKITEQDGGVTYLRGIVMKFAPNIQGPNSIVTANVTITLNPFTAAGGGEVSGIYVSP